MTYKVRVPQSIEEKINSWNLPDPLKICFITKLIKELGDNEESNFRSVVAPIRCLITTITVVDPETYQDRDFIVWFNTTEEPGVRIPIEVHDCIQPFFK